MPEIEQTDLSEILDDLADEYGHTPWLSISAQENADELLGHFLAAPVFVDAMLQQAERIVASGNRIAIQAILIETHCWMDRLTSDHLSDILRDQDDFFADELDDDDDDTNDEFAVPVQRLEDALDAFHAACEQYRKFIMNHRESDSPELMTLWRAATMPFGHIAALEYHIHSSQNLADSPQTAYHATAANICAATLQQAHRDLSLAANARATGHRPSRAHIRECLNRIATAITQYQDFAPQLQNLRPVQLHDDIRHERYLADSAMQLGQQLQQSNEPYLIRPNLAEPTDSLIAYRTATSVTVKQVIDHYEDDNTDPHTMHQHALAFLQEADRLVKSEGPEAHLLRSVARMYYDNVTSALVNTDHGDFFLLQDSLAELTDNPAAVREAILFAFVDDYAGAQILFHNAESDEAAVPHPQAERVIAAGRDSGLTEGQLAALAQAMGHPPADLGVELPQVNAEDVLNILEMVQLDHRLNIHQVRNILQTLGADPEAAEVDAWVAEYSDDSFFPATRP